MKKIIIPVLVIVAFIGVATLAYFAAQHRDNYIREQEAQAIAEERAKDAQTAGRIEELEVQLKATQNERSLYQAECQKGAAAHANLSATLRRNLPAPKCGA